MIRPAGGRTTGGSFGRIAVAAAAAVMFTAGAAVMFTAAAGAAEPLTLAAEGSSRYVIGVPARTSESIRYAAEELQRFVREMTGAELEIAAEPGPDRKRVLLGPLGIESGCVASDEFDALGDEGVILRVCGDDLALAGSEVRGGLYAVYEFLETLGCRWFTPDASRVPALDRIEVGPLDLTRTPGFEFRETSFRESKNADWAARNRYNGRGFRLEARHGGALPVGSLAHSFFRYLPPSEYAESNPEYFSWRTMELFNIAGETGEGPGQPCISNPAVVEIMTRNMLDYIEAHPERKYFNLSQMDNQGYCRDSYSEAVLAEEGQPSGEIIRFVNHVARAVAEKHPDAYVTTLAYTYSEKPPRLARPDPNVIVALCHMYPSCDMHSLAGCFWNAEYVRNLRAWVKISSRVYVWHYTTNYSHYLAPFPNFNAIKADIPFYYENGVKGVYAQGASNTLGANFAALRSYILARLMWDPGADADRLIAEYIEGVYGPSAPMIQEYFDALHEYVKNPTRHAALYSPPHAGHLSPEVMRRADRLMDLALDAAAGDEALMLRVRKQRLSIEYMKLVLPGYFEWAYEDIRPGGPEDQLARLERFIAECRELGVTRLDEWTLLEASAERLRRMIVEDQLGGG